MCVCVCVCVTPTRIIRRRADITAPCSGSVPSGRHRHAGVLLPRAADAARRAVLRWERRVRKQPHDGQRRGPGAGRQISGPRAGVPPATPDAALLQHVLLPLLVGVGCGHAPPQALPSPGVLPGPAGHRCDPADRHRGSTPLPGLGGEPHRAGTRAGCVLAAVRLLPAARAALLPDGRRHPRPAPGASGARRPAALPIGPDRLLLPGPARHDPQAHTALPPAADRGGGEPPPPAPPPAPRAGPTAPPPPQRPAHDWGRPYMPYYLI